MSLRKKLLLISLIVLVLPWSAWQYLREMERFLRHSEERAALATAQSIARAFADLSPQLLRAATDGALYVRRADSPIYVDGYDDEWSPGVAAAQAFPAGSADPALRVALAEDHTAVYAMIRVRDPHIVYDRAAPGQSSPNDHLLLAVESPDGLRHYRIATAAPGWVQATLVGVGRHHARIRGDGRKLPAATRWNCVFPAIWVPPPWVSLRPMFPGRRPGDRRGHRPRRRTGSALAPGRTPRRVGRAARGTGPG